jgi:TonB family protein
MADHPVPEPKLSNLQGSSSGAESDLGELAALFATHGGEGLSAEVSAELALEVVLNEIVEQACLSTGATGAAIVLLRDGEMVCRASSGANVPQSGARLGSESGLTAECIKTREVQRCDDAQADPRADAEASRSLGVRSVMIYPLLRKGELAGLLEVFSPRPGAFGDRDEPTLEALAQRILKNLERASEPLTLPSSPARSAAVESRPTEPVLPRATEVEKPWAGSGMGLNLLDSLSENKNKEENIPLETAGRSARVGFDFVSLALGAVVVVCALLLGTLVGVRLGWRRGAAVRGQVTKAGSRAGFTAQDPAQNMVAQNIGTQSSATQSSVAQNGARPAGGEVGTNAASASASTGAGNAGPADTGSRTSEKKNALAASKPGAKESFPPAGSLLVYENGKEVFRLLPSEEVEGGEVQRASAVEPAGTVELSPDAAEGSLLHRVEPEYPEEARQQRIQGAVVLNVRIGRDGAIQDVKLVSGQAVLANAAIAAVKQWRFKPRMVNGKPVPMQTKVTLNFRVPS